MKKNMQSLLIPKVPSKWNKQFICDIAGDFVVSFPDPQQDLCVYHTEGLGTRLVLLMQLKCQYLLEKTKEATQTVLFAASFPAFQLHKQG